MMQAVLTYTTPKQRQIIRELAEPDMTRLVEIARKVAYKPGYRDVIIWSGNGKVLSRLK